MRKQKAPLVEDIETYAQDIVDTVREPLLMLDTALRVRSANRAFYQTFQVSSEETENRLIYELGNGQWDIPALRVLLEHLDGQHGPQIVPRIYCLRLNRVRFESDSSPQTWLGDEGSYLISLHGRWSGLVLRVDYARWGQTLEDLRHLALSAPHARTRERALALFDITQHSCATQVAGRTGRRAHTVMSWVHAYNAQGPDALTFRRTGGRRPFFVRTAKPKPPRLGIGPSLTDGWTRMRCLNRVWFESGSSRGLGLAGSVPI